MIHLYLGHEYHHCIRLPKSCAVTQVLRNWNLAPFIQYSPKLLRPNHDNSKQWGQNGHYQCRSLRNSVYLGHIGDGPHHVSYSRAVLFRLPEASEGAWNSSWWLWMWLCRFIVFCLCMCVLCRLGKKSEVQNSIASLKSYLSSNITHTFFRGPSTHFAYFSQSIWVMPTVLNAWSSMWRGPRP